MRSDATINAVVDEAKRLRIRAENLTNPASSSYDPWARPYAPSKEAAKKLCQRIANRLERELKANNPDATKEEVAAARARAPGLTISDMQLKSSERTAARTADAESDKRRQARMVRIQRNANEDRRRKVEHLSLGQRLDRAIGQLTVVGNIKAATLEPPVGGSREAPTPLFPGDPAGRAKEKASDLVRGLENEVDGARRRLVEKEAA